MMNAFANELNGARGIDAALHDGFEGGSGGMPTLQLPNTADVGASWQRQHLRVHSS